MSVVWRLWLCMVLPWLRLGGIGCLDIVTFVGNVPGLANFHNKQWKNAMALP